MELGLPSAICEVPVGNVTAATDYYVGCLGFTLDWGDEAGGIAGVSRGDCRLFLANDAFRQTTGNVAPIVIWLNLNSREQVDELYGQWAAQQARMLSTPEPKPWNLYEFCAADSDGNILRVFYDIAWENGQR